MRKWEREGMRINQRCLIHTHARARIYYWQKIRLYHTRRNVCMHIIHCKTVAYCNTITINVKVLVRYSSVTIMIGVTIVFVIIRLKLSSIG